jgi:PAS domain S-box-containing protein
MIMSAIAENIADSKHQLLSVSLNGENGALLAELASIFSTRQTSRPAARGSQQKSEQRSHAYPPVPEADFIYRTLVEQIPAVVFIAYLDEGTSQAYVSPQIEATLGFSQEEWLDDPILWYRQVHPEDKARWSLEAASMFLAGKALKSSYRVLSRTGKIIWFRCEAKMVRHQDGSPWFILGVGFDITELKETERALEDRTETLRNLSTKLLELQDQERRRIARELHDGVGQSLVALKVNFEILASSPQKSQNSLWADSQTILGQCLSDIRNLSYLLHPPLLDDAGLLLAVRAYVDGFSKRSGIEVDLKIPAELLQFPKTVEIAIFRLLQESLTNVIRHSHTKRVEITLKYTDTRVVLKVADFGCGIPPEVMNGLHNGARLGLGLAGMRERVTELGGAFNLQSDKQGTQLEFVLPLKRQTARGGDLASATEKHWKTARRRDEL